MKKLLLTLLLAAAMLICPMAVFAEGETTQSTGETDIYTWDDAAARTIAHKGEELAVGLFKAKRYKGSEVGGTSLFYAEPDGTVKKQAQFVKLSSGRRFVHISDSEGEQWKEVSDSKEYGYAITYHEEYNDFFVQWQSGVVDINGTKYYIQSDGTVQLTQGIVEINGAKYFVQDGGAIRSKTGFFTYNGKKYLIGKAGTVYSKPGLVKWGGKKYVVKSDASICTKKGPVKAGDKIYFVKDKSGVIVKNKAVKYNEKKYHVKSNGVVAVGVHKWNGKFYYSGPKGNLKTKTAMVTYHNKRFLAKKGGLVVVSKKFKYKNKYYIAKKNGAIYIGLFRWKGTLYYSDTKGALLTKAGIVKVGDYSYYVQAGGKVYVNQKFKAGGKTYAANADGQLQKGLFTLNGKYYYADSDYAVRTSQEIITYEGKYYFNNKGGGLTKNDWVNYNNRHYYAGSDAAFKTSKFTVSGVTFNPNSKGEISDEEYKKLFPDPADDEGNDAEDVD